jgi:hypothetical protein
LHVSNGALVFLFLCVACVVVWSRLLVLWCGFRRGGLRSQRRRWRCRRLGRHAAAAGDATQDSLQAPLLNPLQHEAPLPSTLLKTFAVELAPHRLSPVGCCRTLPCSKGCTSSVRCTHCPSGQSHPSCAALRCGT